MEYRILGASGIRVSTLCLGTAFFGIRPAGRAVDAIVGRALDAGSYLAVNQEGDALTDEVVDGDRDMRASGHVEAHCR